jgi:hypothetical protein
MQSSVCAALRPALSRHVHDRAACPRSLYYIRYYTGAAISTSKPTEAPIPRRTVCRTWDTR